MRQQIWFIIFAAICLLSVPATAQFKVSDINTFHTDSGTRNCSPNHQTNISDPGWEYNCDPGAGGAGSCSGTMTCGNIPTNTVATAGTCGTVPDGKARELDVSWTGGQNSGVNFHPSLNSLTNGNLDTTDSNWTWGGWFCYTNLSQIWRIELDLNQIVTSSDILILAAQCNLSNGRWQFQNGWGLTSDIPCNTTTEFTANKWHHIVINAVRCATFTHGSNCATTYKSVSVDGVTTPCGANCISTNSQDSQGWTPLGGLIENVQLDPHTTGTGSMNAYADLMTTHSGPPTTVGTPTFSPSGGAYSGLVTISCQALAICCYTSDGTTPTANGGGSCTHGTQVSSTVNVSGNETLKAIGSEDGIDFDSNVGTAIYTGSTTKPIIPLSFFSMHYEHSENSLPNLQALTYGSFRLWDTGTDMDTIATCDPNGTTCQPDRAGSPDWNWTTLDKYLADMHTLGVTDVFYTFGGIPEYMNLCSTDSPNSCGANPNVMPTTVCNQITDGGCCGNTYAAGCILPSDLPLNGGTIGDGNNKKWQRFINAIADHVYGITTTTACPGNTGYLTCHAKIVFWDPMNEWDRDYLLDHTHVHNMTIYASYAQMQRMTADLSSVIKGAPFTSLGAQVTTPSMEGFVEGVEKNFLYCNSSPVSVCNNSLLGTHPSDSIDIYIVHDYIHSGLPENILTSASSSYMAMHAWLQTPENTKWANVQWMTEGSWGSDVTDVTDYDMQAAFVGRVFLTAWAAGWRRYYWYAADNLLCAGGVITKGTGTLMGIECPGTIFDPGLWWSGKAENAVASWMVGNTMTNLCAVITGTVWSCTLQDPLGNNYLAVWDTAQSCAGSTNPLTSHGTCTTSVFSVPVGYDQYQTLDQTDGKISIGGCPGCTVKIGAKPILLSKKGQGNQFCAACDLSLLREWRPQDLVGDTLPMGTTF